jgi:hypothetical protein
MAALVVESLTQDPTNLRPRFMKKNKVGKFNITAASEDGFCTKPQGNKTGLANLYASHTLAGTSGATEADYVVQIDDVSAGETIGYATFRWGRQYSDQSGLTYMAHSVPTTNDTIHLENGVQITWTAGSTVPDFVLGDRWTFQSRFPTGPAAASNYHRDVKFFGPPGQLTNTIVVGLTEFSDQMVNVLALLDHNLGDGTTITYDVGDNTHSFAADPSGKNILYFRDQTQPLHTITIDSTNDTITQQQIGYIYLGQSFEFQDRRRDVEYSILFNALGDYSQDIAKFTDYTQRAYTVTYPLVEGVSTNTDIENYMSFRDELVQSQGYEEPVLFHPNPSDTRGFGLYFFDDNGFLRDNVYINLFDISLSFFEVPKEVHN